MELFSSNYFQIMIQVILNLVLLMVMVKLVWVLGPPNLLPIKLVVVLVVVILCCQVVGYIHPLVIHTNTGPIIHHIL